MWFFHLNIKISILRVFWKNAKKMSLKRAKKYSKIFALSFKKMITIFIINEKSFKPKLYKQFEILLNNDKNHLSYILF